MALHQIILIGDRMETIWLGVKEFHPDVVHLLYSDAVADAYIPMLGMLPNTVNAHQYHIDPFDVQKIMLLCESIRERLSPGDRLMYNLTEGTKVSAAAAMKVADKYSDEVVYYSQEGEVINLRNFDRRPVAARVSNREFLELFGNELDSYNTASQMLPLDVVTAAEVKSFIEKNTVLYHRIQKYYRKTFLGRIENLPERFVIEHPGRVEIVTSGGSLSIKNKGKLLFSSAHNLATRLFFTGRWWEVLVSDKVYRWDLSRRSDKSGSEVWRNVQFLIPGTGRTKNELDIMVNEGIRLLFIECKSGYISQENIYKIYSTKVTYGGDHSIGVLVSYYPLEESIKTKCEDLRIRYFAPETEAERCKALDRLPVWLDKVARQIEL